MLDWLFDLLKPVVEAKVTPAQSIIEVFIVMALGIAIGKVKIFKVSLGISGVMFSGILMGHLGYHLHMETLEWLRDAGLILFVYAVGMQVGPSFFSSFKKDGIIFNSLAVGTVLMGGITTIVLLKVTPNTIDNLVGIMSGAVTNTPGLGAAKAALSDVSKHSATVFNDPANGYALSYPFGVLGAILMMLIAKAIFRININDETKLFEQSILLKYPSPEMKKCRVIHSRFIGNTISDLVKAVAGEGIIVSRLKHSGSTVVMAPTADTIIQERDVLMLVGLPKDVETATGLLGRESTDSFIESQENMITKSLLVSKNTAVQRSLAQLNLEGNFDVRVTRVFRSGMELLAKPSLVLHFGDRIRVVGNPGALDNVAKVVGNSEKRLQEPELFSIFLGIILGIIVGSIPLLIPGLSAPVKLGMAAGPLLVALIISRYGGLGTIHSFLNQSAMLFMKDFGICLFFATVGIKAGGTFYETFLKYNGWSWIGYGAIITVFPLLLMVIVGRIFFKINYLQLVGLMAGTYTDPAALAFSSSYFKSDIPNQAYATVYPMVTISRILLAQLLVLFFAG
jgi:putative transport protein